MIQRLGHDAELRGTPDDLTYDDRYILPGVGAFDEGVRRLQTSGWFDHLQLAPDTTHILGICLGMQSAKAWRVRVHQILSELLSTDQVRLRQAPTTPLEFDCGW